MFSSPVFGEDSPREVDFNDFEKAAKNLARFDLVLDTQHLSDPLYHEQLSRKFGMPVLPKMTHQNIHTDLDKSQTKSWTDWAISEDAALSKRELQFLNTYDKALYDLFDRGMQRFCV
jgi:hypothetical protein